MTAVASECYWVPNDSVYSEGEQCRWGGKIKETCHRNPWGGKYRVQCSLLEFLRCVFARWRREGSIAGPFVEFSCCCCCCCCCCSMVVSTSIFEWINDGQSNAKGAYGEAFFFFWFPLHSGSEIKRAWKKLNCRDFQTIESRVRTAPVVVSFSIVSQLQRISERSEKWQNRAWREWLEEG